MTYLSSPSHSPILPLIYNLTLPECLEISVAGSYYSHGQANRWASFVIQDVLDEWIESTVIMEQGSLGMPIAVAYEQVKHLNLLTFPYRTLVPPIDLSIYPIDSRPTLSIV